MLMPQRKGRQPGYAVLLHGMGRTHRSMNRIERSLSKEGYEVINIGYKSTRQPIDDLVEVINSTVRTRCTNDTMKVSFVTHSLGGILLRSYLKKHRDVNLGRVVMLSPPNGGSELVDRFGGVWAYKKITGPAGQVLGTGQDDLPRALGPVDFDLGVIAGGQSLNPLYSYFIGGRDDGKVSVASSAVEGMRDFLVVDSSHTFIMQRSHVIQQVLHFLEHGHFERDPPDSAENIYEERRTTNAARNPAVGSG
jgi:triacylglycerol lipase